MPELTQENLSFTLKTVLGKDKLILQSMTGSEQLSGPFRYELELLSEDDELDATKILGTPLTVTIDLGRSKTRYFNGYVSRFVWTGLGKYQATVVPWLWLLTRSTDCRIFQEKKVPDILENVFKNTFGFSDYKMELNGTYPNWEYCVQYRETAFNFVSRLMEQEGIYYYFEHSDSKHDLVLCDNPSSHFGNQKIPFRPPGQAEAVDFEHVSRWEVESRYQPGKCELRDFDFQKPATQLENKAASTLKSKLKNAADYEVYDYPGEYIVSGDGENYVKARMAELDAQVHVAAGTSDALAMTCGETFTLSDHPRKDQNKKYLVTAAQYHISNGSIDPSDNQESEFSISFTAIEARQQFRPPRVTPKPVVQGPQTAIVTGPSGEEIHTDKYGRVKVQFHWDRQGKKDEKSSCFIRVAQMWAGKTWGAICLPRICQEVVVDFLEGDPDRPLITGSVYNDEQKPPYKLPDNMTKWGFKSQSTKKGDSETFNELRFEEKKGEEEVYFHAENNFNRVVENNDTLKVGFDKKNEGDQTIEILNNQILKVGCSDAADGSQTIEVWKDRNLTVKEGNETVKIEKGNQDITIAKGNHTLKVDAGESTIEAAKKLTLKVGSSEIVMTPQDITIKASKIIVKSKMDTEIKAGMNLKAEGKMNAEIKAGMNFKAQGGIAADLKGAMSTVEGSGMTTVKGGIVMIN